MSAMLTCELQGQEKGFLNLFCAGKQICFVLAFLGDSSSQVHRGFEGKKEVKSAFLGCFGGREEEKGGVWLLILLFFCEYYVLWLTSMRVRLGFDRGRGVRRQARGTARIGMLTLVKRG